VEFNSWTDRKAPTLKAEAPERGYQVAALDTLSYALWAAADHLDDFERSFVPPLQWAVASLPPLRVGLPGCDEFVGAEGRVEHEIRGMVKTGGLACHDEVARSVAGRGRSCRRDQESSLTIRSVDDAQPVTNG
jgi:hypothetical protein